MLRKREVIGWSILILTFAWPLALWGVDTEVQEPKTPIARLEVQPARVDWVPQADYQHLILTVAGPGNLYIRQEFEADQVPYLSLFDSKGTRLPDGSYAYELRGEPQLDRAVREKAGFPKPALVQSGYLWVQGGSFDDRLPIPPGRSGPTHPPGSVSAKAVQGRTCIGADCSAGDDNVPALKLKELFDTRITFENSGCCTPYTRNWALQANDSANGTGDFLIRDLTAGTVPFRIGSGGTGVPDNSFTIFYNGNIGLGTLTPAAQLHVFGTDSGFRNKIIVENANTGAASPRELLEIKNKGAAVFILKDTSVAERWGVGTWGSSLLIDNQAHSGVEMSLDKNGNATFLGTVTPGSSRTIKEDFSAIEPREVLQRVAALPITTWSYKQDPGVRHIGPMAEDFFAAFAVGADNKGISVTDSAGVTLAAIQGLNQIVREKTGEIATLQRENADLTKRIEALEALLSKVMNTAQPQSTPAEEN